MLVLLCTICSGPFEQQDGLLQSFFDREDDEELPCLSAVDSMIHFSGSWLFRPQGCVEA